MLLSTIEEHVQEYEFKTPPLKPPVSAVISSYIIIDAMAIVNKFQIKKSHNKISNVQQFVDHFVKQVESSSTFCWCSTDMTFLCP